MQSTTPENQDENKGASKDKGKSIDRSMMEIEAGVENLAVESKSSATEIKLNPEQQLAYDKCIGGEKSVFCTGGAGCGKSVVLSAVVRTLQSRASKGIAVTASTGSAALLIGGTTLHRFAGTGIEENDLDRMVQRVMRGRAESRWLDTHMLLIDEISMVSPAFFENLSKLASLIRRRPEPFGGIRVIVFGDFLQLPPVSTSKSRGSDKRYIFQTATWMKMGFERVNLTSSMRQSSDTRFKSMLEEIRFGRLNSEVIDYVLELDRPINQGGAVQPVRLCATKRSVNVYNEEMLGRIQMPEVVFECRDYGNTALLKQYFSEDKITLKVGAQVMLTRNLSATLVNGSTGTVVGIEMVDDDPVPAVEFAPYEGISTGAGAQVVSIQPVAWEILEGGRVVATRIQTPLILAWALTIHKSQGKTIPAVSIDAQGVFETGQLYVALSRCPTSAGVRMTNFAPAHVMADAVCVAFYLGMARGPVTKKIAKKVTGRRATDVAKETENE